MRPAGEAVVGRCMSEPDDRARPSDRMCARRGLPKAAPDNGRAIGRRAARPTACRSSGRIAIVTQTETDISAVWQEYRERPTVELRNRLVEKYLPLVKYNAERIWARLPDGVELDDLISAGVFG